MTIDQYDSDDDMMVMSPVVIALLTSLIILFTIEHSTYHLCPVKCIRVALL